MGLSPPLYRQNRPTGVVCGRLCPEREYACVCIPPMAENGSQRLVSRLSRCPGRCILRFAKYCPYAPPPAYEGTHPGITTIAPPLWESLKATPQQRKSHAQAMLKLRSCHADRFFL
jgi:hypothetical protein